MRKLKHILAALLLVTMMGICVIPAQAYNSVAPTVQDTSRCVYDMAELFTEEEEADLEQRLTRLQSQKEYRILVVTTANNPGTAMAYADDFFDFNNFGTDGILYLIDMDNREEWISTTGRCTSAAEDRKNSYSSSDIDGILDQTNPKLRDGNYYQGVREFIKGVQKKGNLLYTLLPTAMSLGISALLALLTFVVLIGKHQAAKPVNNAKIVVNTTSFQVGRNAAIFMGAHTTQRRIPRSNGPGGGGGGGGMHVGGSGTSHGGGGRSF